jgi:hypothetical protein
LEKKPPVVVRRCPRRPEQRGHFVKNIIQTIAPPNRGKPRRTGKGGALLPHRGRQLVEGDIKNTPPAQINQPHKAVACKVRVRRFK